jgi:hypothetical protein
MGRDVFNLKTYKFADAMLSSRTKVVQFFLRAQFFLRGTVQLKLFFERLIALWISHVSLFP